MDKEKLLLIKGDVTAIQHYIFSVKNKGAARLLKQRSQNVKKITEQTSNELTRELAASPLITGGGYFLLKAPKPPGWEGIWTHLRNKYETKERVGRLNLVLSYYEVPDEQEMESHYAEFRGLLEEQAGKDKLQQGKSIPGFFDPYPAPQTKEPTGTEPEDIPIWDDCDEKLIDEPHPEKGIIDFDFLASFAQQRTGSDLLAALKLDVDNLGECFKNLQTKEASDELSGRLKKFFGEKKKLREKEAFNHNGTEHRFRDNIYLVFAGGDDTFILGGFDAVLEFTKLLHGKFCKFSEELLNQIPQLKKEITFSASIIFFKPTHPLLSMAATAENNLALAKSASVNKNRISVLGEIFTWEEYCHLLEITNQLVDLIKNKRESKSIISRIRESRKGFAAALRHSDQGSLDIPRVWRLFYYLRNTKPENKDEIEKLVEEYETLIMNAFMKKEKGNPVIFPIAARIAEYKLKNHQS